MLDTKPISPKNGLTLKENIMDYEKLFHEALFHLRCVSGSRNSFSPEVHQELFEKGVRLERSPVVERLHKEANDFLKTYDK